MAKKPTPEDFADWFTHGDELIWGVPDTDADGVLRYLDKLANNLPG